MVNCDELRDYIYENFNVPADNTTMAPSMLDAILEYAEELPDGDQAPFLMRMLTSLEGSEILQFDY